MLEEHNGSSLSLGYCWVNPLLSPRHQGVKDRQEEGGSAQP